MTKPTTRRSFLTLSATSLIALHAPQAWPADQSAAPSKAPSGGAALVRRTDRARTLRLADRYLPLAPETITSFRAERSPGTANDFYSEADYFWPDPANPSGPYKEIDGRTNPGNFLDHRKAMLAMAMAVPALASAWLLTKKQPYANRAADHLRAWFITPATRMTPNLEYAQAIRQGATGRSWGIIDTLHLAEVARATTVLAQTRALSPADTESIAAWFRAYLDWLQHSKKGIAERDSTNNHAVAWALQASEFARLAADEPTRAFIRNRYHTVLIEQMDNDGSYPRELARTKPYGYSIFNFDIMAALAWSLDREAGINWATPTGRGMCRAAHFLYPFLKDKSTWPYARDVQHFEAWPVRSPGLLFCGLACKQNDDLALWQTLNPDPTDTEVNRNFPIRQPLLWM